MDKQAPASQQAGAAQRWIDPAVLSRLGNLELLAKTVVDGMLTGLHRSPNFGFSQEFAEYRAYNEGDDLRFVDWNVYARTDRTYIKRFRGDTNTALTILLDASGSMGFGATDAMGKQGVRKIDYARYVAASLAYMAKRQHDAIGLVVFDDEVRQVIPPASRPDTLPRIFSALDKSDAAAGTDIEGALESLHTLAGKRGLLAVISDFYTDPEKLLESLQPLVHRQQDIMLIHLLDPTEIRPSYDSIVSLADLESQNRTDVDPPWLTSTYRERIEAHCKELESQTLRAGAEYRKVETNEALDDALYRYLLFRQRKQ